ncbi:Alpha-galactosidase [Lachnospiraceae bacterium TWA4]|nr:Alpha-galactosidase [Lachnospiraceae bacterium TWA4]
MLSGRNEVIYSSYKNTTYQMKVNEYGVLLHLYYGRKISDVVMDYTLKNYDRGFSGNPYEADKDRTFSLDTVPQEFPGTGVGDYRINCVNVENADGSGLADFRYVSHKIRDSKYFIPGLPAVYDETDEAKTLIILLEDPVTHLQAKLFYGVLEDNDIITRTVVYINNGKEDIKLTKAYSACLDLPFGEWDLVHFHGRHCMERQMERVSSMNGIKSIESKRGASSHHHNPFVILCEPNTNEEYGDCYGMMFVYSGNHKTQIETDQTGATRVVMGIHEEHFGWNLSAGESFYAPEVILTYSAHGFEKLSQNYHETIRTNICRGKYKVARRPILINNWEATYFDFDEEKIYTIAKSASELGIEMLVLDDGWFGVRNNDFAGLGDWFVNEEKLKGGLPKLVKRVNDLGMKFGIWVEPEMVNEDTNLYREHPEWVLKVPSRNPNRSRYQLVLDMSRPEVIDYLFDCYTKIFDSTNIEYVKWDMNRSIADVFSTNLPANRQGEVYHRYVLGVYELLDRLEKRYPNLLIEGCAGGGGRFDAGMLYYTPQIWCSDDTDAIERLQIQYGTSFGYPVSTMGAHVSASPNHQTGRNTSLETRGVVAMSGTFGYELDLGLLGEEEKNEVKAQVETFKRYYDLIQDGKYYRLSNAMDAIDYCAWQFVAKDQGETLVNMVQIRPRANGRLIHLKFKGLNPEALYQLDGSEEVFNGAALMYGGYTFERKAGDFPTYQLHFIRVK